MPEWLAVLLIATVFYSAVTVGLLMLFRTPKASEVRVPDHSQWCGGEIKEIDVSQATSYLGIDQTIQWVLKRQYFRCTRCGSIVEVDIESGKVMARHWNRS